MEIDKRVSRRGVLGMAVIGTAAALLGGAGGFFGGRLTGPPAAIADWGTADIPDQTGRRVLVTGGNGYPMGDRSGLGYHAALALAQAGADVTIASRNAERGEAAVRLIREAAPSANVRFGRLDLSDLSSVRAFAARINQSGEGIDLLVNNAGVMGRKTRETSVDGFERVLATNTLGHFMLTMLLRPALQLGRQARVVWVSSMRTANAMRFDDLQFEQGYDYAAAYDQSKLANLLLAFEFERRSRAGGWGIASLAAHPGVSRTNLIPDGPGLDSPEGWRFNMLGLMFQPAAQGALPLLYAGAAPRALAGGYYGPAGLQGLRGAPGVARPPVAAEDPEAAGRLWAALEGLGAA